MPQIHLVGAAHLDPWGEERLNRAVDAIKPDIVTVEALDFGQGQFPSKDILQAALFGRMIIRDFPVEKFTKYLTAYGYEVRAAKRLSQTIPVHLIDIDTENAGGQDDRDSLKSFPDFFQKYIPLAEIGYMIFENSIAARCYATASMEDVEVKKLVDWIYDNIYDNLYGKQDLERDAAMSSSIRSLGGNGAKLMHVGGAGHIFGNYANIYTQLADLGPKRYKLKEF